MLKKRARWSRSRRHLSGGGGEGPRATGGEPSPSLASAASRRGGPCTRSVVCGVVQGARSSERERYARQASRLGGGRPFPPPACGCKGPAGRRGKARPG